jgi:hypothetical protein
MNQTMTLCTTIMGMQCLQQHGTSPVCHKNCQQQKHSLTDDRYMYKKKWWNLLKCSRSIVANRSKKHLRIYMWPWNAHTHTHTPAPAHTKGRAYAPTHKLHGDTLTKTNNNAQQCRIQIHHVMHRRQLEQENLLRIHSTIAKFDFNCFRCSSV